MLCCNASRGMLWGKVSLGLWFWTANQSKIDALKLFNWLELVLKPVNHESTSKILEVSKEHGQQKPQADCCCGFSRAVNKPTTQETSHANDFVITKIKSHARDKTLLQGITFVFVRFLPISDYFKCYTCLAVEILLYHLECCQTFWVCCILWNFPQLVDNIFVYHFQCIFSGSVSFPWFKVCFPLFYIG